MTKLWFRLIQLWCFVTRQDAVWLKTEQLKKRIHLRIVHKEYDPWKSDPLLYVNFRFRRFYLDEDGTLYVRAASLGTLYGNVKSGNVKFVIINYKDQWKYVNKQKQMFYDLRNRA